MSRRGRLAGLETSPRFELFLSAAVLAALELEVLVTNLRHGPLALNALCVGAMGATLFWRRPALAAYVLFGALAMVQSAFLTPVTDLVTAIPALMLATLYVATRHDHRPALAGLAIGALVLVGANALDDRGLLGDFLFPFGVFVLAPWAGGRLIRDRALLTRELRQKAERLEREREERARLAVVEERTRIGRELHDLVAHDVSVMVVQAEGARRVLHKDPEQARQAAALIEGIGRESLTEMRRLLGVLRREDADVGLAPQPSIERVGGLVARARGAGLGVELRVEGEPRPLGRGLGLTAYRIVQEGLTNVIRHAGPAHATVVVRYSPGELELDVIDTGRGSPDVHEGQGLVGLRERVALYGGTLTARPRPDGGFALRARLPLTGATERVPA